jgi:hypothetical protein
MVDSFITQSLNPEDRLWLYGDGCDVQWVRGYHSQVQFESKPKSSYYGHAHLVEGMGKVETTHYTFIGDDDAYTHRAFEMMRNELMEKPLISGFRGWAGFEHEYLTGPLTGRVCLGGWQLWMPRAVKLDDFSTFSDAEAMRLLEARGVEVLSRPDLIPVLLRADLASKMTLKEWVC